MNKNAMKLAIWMKRFKEREELKLTVEEYCERIGEPRKKYYYWHKKAVDLAFAQQESNLQPAPIINNPVSNKTPCFAEYSHCRNLRLFFRCDDIHPDTAATIREYELLLT